MTAFLVSMLAWLALWVLVAGGIVLGEHGVAPPRWAARLWDVIRRRPKAKKFVRAEVVHPGEFVAPDGEGGLLIGRVMSQRNGIPHVLWRPVDPEDYLTDDDPPT